MVFRSVSLTACCAVLALSLIGPAQSIPKDIEGIEPSIPAEPEPPQPPQPPLLPQRQVRVAAPLIAAIVEAAASGSQIHLNNHGPQRGSSWHQANDSSLRLSAPLGGREQRFNLPEAVKDLDCGLLCPDLGDAKFYINDMNLQQIQVGWQNPSFQLSLLFESSGREIKGYHTGALTSLGDNGIPDVQIDNARLDVWFRPVAVSGRLTYQVIKTDFTANIAATGGCNVFRIDICDPLFDYKDQIVSQVKTRVLNQLNDPVLRDRVAASLQPRLSELGVGSVTSVQVDGNDLVLTTPAVPGRVLEPALPIGPLRHL